MDIKDILKRKSPPGPWEEGGNIPWHESGFSERMLQEHLSQAHDLASRRFEIIDRHVEWIHRELLGEQPARVLDLGCGPGLYANRLAKLGHECVGIDYSPASIKYADKEADKEKLSCEYLPEDIRKADFGAGFDLVMLIFGEFNVFTRAEAESILQKAMQALRESGVFLLEAHSLEAIHKIGHQPSSWYSEASGLFANEPHICLQENFWDANSRTATVRFLVIEAETGGTTAYAVSYQAYTDAEYEEMLKKCGFSCVTKYPSLTGTHDAEQKELIVLTAKK